MRFGITFGGIAVRIIDAVRRAGRDGIAHDDLFDLIYRDRPSNRSALKAYVNRINEMLAMTSSGTVIHGGTRQPYRLGKRKQQRRAA